MEKCRWRYELTDICGCGCAEFIGQEVDDDICESCEDHTEKRYEDNYTKEIDYEL